MGQKLILEVRKICWVFSEENKKIYVIDTFGFTTQKDFLFTKNQKIIYNFQYGN